MYKQVLVCSKYQLAIVNQLTTLILTLTVAVTFGYCHKMSSVCCVMSKAKQAGHHAHTARFLIAIQMYFGLGAECAKDGVVVAVLLLAGRNGFAVVHVRDCWQ